ncbi:septum formation initiator [Streptomyces sp. NBC_01006]|nr:septum formation initiator [Streptomyces sp. NBC_01006]
MPFVLLVVALLAGGLISLLLLNSALNQGSFQLSRLKKETTALTDEEQALQRDVDGYSAPDALQRRAHELGLVPGGSPVFIGPDGKVTGTAAPAEALPPPSPAAATGSAPAATPGQPQSAAQAGAPGPAQGSAPGGGPTGTPGGAPAGAPQAGQPAPGGAPSPTRPPEGDVVTRTLPQPPPGVPPAGPPPSTGAAVGA